MSKRFAAALVAALWAFGLGGAAQASLIGASVSYERVFGSLTLGLGSAIVGPGPEFIDAGRAQSDIGDSTIDLTVISSGGFASANPHFIQYSGLTWINDPAAVIASIDVTFGGWISTPGGADPFSASNVSIFGTNAIRVDISGQLFAADTFLRIAITPGHSQQLPEPASLALFGFGLLGLGIAAQRARRRNTK